MSRKCSVNDFMTIFFINLWTERFSGEKQQSLSMWEPDLTLYGDYPKLQINPIVT